MVEPATHHDMRVSFSEPAETCIQLAHRFWQPRISNKTCWKDRRPGLTVNSKRVTDLAANFRALHLRLLSLDLMNSEKNAPMSRTQSKTVTRIQGKPLRSSLILAPLKASTSNRAIRSSATIYRATTPNAHCRRIKDALGINVLYH